MPPRTKKTVTSGSIRATKKLWTFQVRPRIKPGLGPSPSPWWHIINLDYHYSNWIVPNEKIIYIYVILAHILLCIIIIIYIYDIYMIYIYIYDIYIYIDRYSFFGLKLSLCNPILFIFPVLLAQVIPQRWFLTQLPWVSQPMKPYWTDIGSFTRSWLKMK